MKALGSGNRQRNQLQIPHGIFADRVMSPSRDGRYRRRGPLHLCEYFLRNTSCQSSPAMTTPGSARASRSITPLQINQLEIDETIPKRANYIPMHSKATRMTDNGAVVGRASGLGRQGLAAPAATDGGSAWQDASRQTLSRHIEPWLNLYVWWTFLDSGSSE
ncbi:hypothetical protein B0H14DRAFT_2967265 [Mycena olivaceomarginata]|nr:hypothetical protein B0H14DRAFT_2967265 [Mycena olivaceomarginata]